MATLGAIELMGESISTVLGGTADQLDQAVLAAEEPALCAVGGSDCLLPEGLVAAEPRSICAAGDTGCIVPEGFFATDLPDCTNGADNCIVPLDDGLRAGIIQAAPSVDLGTGAPQTVPAGYYQTWQITGSNCAEGAAGCVMTPGQVAGQDRGAAVINVNLPALLEPGYYSSITYSGIPARPCSASGGTANSGESTGPIDLCPEAIAASAATGTIIGGTLNAGNTMLLGCDGGVTYSNAGNMASAADCLLPVIYQMNGAAVERVQQFTDSNQNRSQFCAGLLGISPSGSPPVETGTGRSGWFMVEFVSGVPSGWLFNNGFANTRSDLVTRIFCSGPPA